MPKKVDQCIAHLLPRFIGPAAALYDAKQYVIDSDVTAIASGSSTAVATASDDSSAQAAATAESVASANATNKSTSTAAADIGSASTASASNSSDSTFVAENDSAAEATADDSSSSTAVADATSNATATADGGSAADAAGNATVLASGGGVGTIAANLQDKIDQITGQATILKGVSADLAMNAITGAAGPSMQETIEDRLGRDSSTPTETASDATANSKSNSVSTATARVASAEEGSAASATASSANAATARAANAKSAEAVAFNDSVTEVTITAGAYSSVNVSTPASILTGMKDAPISIPFSVLQQDGGMFTSVVLTGMPAGTLLSAGTSNADGTEWSFTDIPADLMLTPPLGFTGELGLNITAASSSDSEASATQLVRVTENGQVDNPVVTIDDAEIVEGDSGQTDLVITVRRDTNVGRISVPFSTESDSATAGEDFEAVSGTVEFTDGGSLTSTIVIPIFGDTMVESNETFKVMLGIVEGVTIGDGEAIATIQDNDRRVRAEFDLGRCT